MQSYKRSKTLVRLASLWLGVVFTLVIGQVTPAIGLAQPTEILWDIYGVPHIYSQSVPQLFRAFGWAQMHSHANLMLQLYGQARGRAAEYWGEDYLESDRWVQTVGIPERAQIWYEAQTPDFRQYLDAFADGINAYAHDHADLIEDDVEVVLPINGVDLLAHLQRVLHFTFMVNPEQVTDLEDSAQTATARQLDTIGSNGWAIAPARTLKGHAMLLANPHLPWSDLFRWYEAQLTAPGIDAYGAALVGIPVLNIAFNDHLGWTHTVNTHDGWDAYELNLVGTGYELDGEIRAFDLDTRILKVKQADGAWREEPLQIRRSVHGPVVMEQDNRAIALRVVGLDQPGAIQEWWDMARATNLNEFEAALQRLQIPMFTVMYADRDGHILHVFNGEVPVRSGGQFDDWLDRVPGNTSATLWTETHPYSDLPRVLDPPSGWLQNANDPPWTTTLPQVLNPEDYPSYIAPHGPMWFRAQEAARMLMNDDQISFEELVQYKHSTRVSLADRLLDDLIPAVRQHGNSLAQQAADVLENWDRHTNADSRGAVLFAAWADAVDSPDLFAIPWTEASPLTTPDGLAHPAKAVSILEEVAAEIQASYGSLDVSWGEVFRLHAGDRTLPANGGPSSLGIFRHVWFAPHENKQFTAIGGDSYVAVVEFSDPVRAMALMSYGNATQPGFPESPNQLELFADQALRPVWRSRQDIEAHLVSRQVF